MSWVFFAIAGTFLWAWSNIFDKVLRTRHLKDSMALMASFGIFGLAFGAVLWNFAILLGPVTLVSVFVSFQSMFVLLFATIFSVRFPLFIKEAVDAKTIGLKVAAIGLMALGLLLLSHG